MSENLTTPTMNEPSRATNVQSEPGGFLPRFAAMVVDGVIITVLRLPITAPIQFVIKMVKASDTLNTVSNIVALEVALLALALTIHYVYVGWFYHNKGATPGKMLFGLKVVRDDTGTYLTYGQAFLRETVGKLISGLPLGLGYFWALGRPDRKTFHDLMFKTQVLHQKQ